MPTLSSILGIVTNLISGLAKLAGSLGLYLAGKRKVQVDFEKAAKKEALKDAERWKNRPRDKSSAVIRMRDYKKPDK